MLVLGIGGESVGLIVDEIIDIVEDFLNIEIASATPGTIGTATVQDTVVAIIDISHYVNIARPDALARGVTNRFTVLLIDDRLFFRDMLSPILAAAGYKVTTASSGTRRARHARQGCDLPRRGHRHRYARHGRLHAGARDQARPQATPRLPIIALAAHAAPIISRRPRRAACSASSASSTAARFSNMVRASLGSQVLGTHKLEERIIREFAA